MYWYFPPLMSLEQTPPPFPEPAEAANDGGKEVAHRPGRDANAALKRVPQARTPAQPPPPHSHHGVPVVAGVSHRHRRLQVRRRRALHQLVPDADSRAVDEQRPSAASAGVVLVLRRRRCRREHGSVAGESKGAAEDGVVATVALEDVAETGVAVMVAAGEFGYQVVHLSLFHFD